MRTFVKLTRFLSIFFWPAIVLVMLYLIGTYACQTPEGRQTLYQVCVLSLAFLVFAAFTALPLWLIYKLVTGTLNMRWIHRWRFRFRETSRQLDREDYFARNRK